MSIMFYNSINGFITLLVKNNYRWYYKLVLNFLNLFIFIKIYQNLVLWYGQYKWNLMDRFLTLLCGGVKRKIR